MDAFPFIGVKVVEEGDPARKLIKGRNWLETKGNFKFTEDAKPESEWRTIQVFVSIRLSNTEVSKRTRRRKLNGR